MQTNLRKAGPIKLHWERLNNDQWTAIKNDIANKNEQIDTTKYTLDSRIEIPTGSYEGFKLKNIYDLAGNMFEWTTEVGNHQTSTETKSNGSYAVYRGGGFHNYGTESPLCYRRGDYGESYLNSTFVNIGFRVVLYIK